MARKNQFKGTHAPHSFFDRKIRQTGNTTSLSIGKLIPKGWTYVRVETLERQENAVILKVTKLLGDDYDTSNPLANKAS